MTNSRGVLLVVSAPLGFGKATLCQALLDREPNARLSVSCTTRPRQAREAEGFDYFFLKEDMFKKRLNEKGFLEWVNINGHYFGTPKDQVWDVLLSGKDVVLNVDARGAQMVKEALPEAVLVFVCPPDMVALAERLHSLSESNAETLVARLKTAQGEIAEAVNFDYIVINEDMIEMADSLSVILRSEHLRVLRKEEDIRKLISSASLA